MCYFDHIFFYPWLIKASHSLPKILSNGTLLSPSSVWSHPIDGCNRETPGPVVFIHLKAFQYAKLFREFPSLFHLRQWRDVIWSDLKERLGSWWPFFTFSSSSPPLVKIDVEFKWQCHVPPPLAFILLFIPQTCYRKNIFSSLSKIGNFPSWNANDFLTRFWLTKWGMLRLTNEKKKRNLF